MSTALRDALLIAGTLAAAAASSGYVGYRLWQQRQPPPPVVHGEVLRGCDLQRGPCVASFPGGGRLTLDITPRPIPSGASFRVEVKLYNLAANVVQIDLGSPSMNMGNHRQMLTAHTDTLFVGQTTLPACTRGRMDWQLTVTARTRRGPLGARFGFESGAGSRRRG